jgi:microcystin-dependent protein
MAITYVDYTATAGQTDFDFTFPYLEDEHVKVEINGAETTDFTIVATPSTKVVLDSGATAGANVRVRRRSAPNQNLVDFVNGSVLTESELDLAYRHNRYLSEEIAELNDQSLQKESGGTEWDALGLRIKNVGYPTDTTDASTKLYVDNKFNQTVYGSDAPLKWQFTGVFGSNTTYTVTGAEISGDTAYAVSINGLVQEPTVDYTVNPDTDTLTIIPSLNGGEDIVIIQRGFGVAVTGTVPSSSIPDGAITVAKLENPLVGDINITGNYKINGATLVPTGTVSAFAGSSAPSGYLLCDGSEYSETGTYAALFSVLGSTYNTGGETADHFRVPDLRGRVIAGLDNMGGSSANRLTNPTATTINGIDGDILGNTGGYETHVITLQQLAAHQHNGFGSGVDAFGEYGSWGTDGLQNLSVSSTGDDYPHNNVQPTIILNYIIKT